jgi:CheY-like chemotaxis protein
MKEKVVFIVDDDKLIQHFLEYSFIGRENCSVKVFSKAEDCLNNLDAAPDCIILDHYFLGKEERLMTGLEALVRIRDVNKSVPVIILSNLNDKELIGKYLANGATNYVIKEGFFLNQLFDVFNELTFNN